MSTKKKLNKVEAAPTTLVSIQEFNRAQQEAAAALQMANYFAGIPISIDAVLAKYPLKGKLSNSITFVIRNRAAIKVILELVIKAVKEAMEKIKALQNDPAQ